MATVTGPLLSFEASGSVAQTLTWLNSRTGAHVRRLAPQKNLRSPAKTAHRVMFGFLQSAWAGLTITEKTSWTQLATRTSVTLMNAFTQHNLNRWTQSLTPLKTAPT